MIDGYGRELFLDYVPPSARDRAVAVPLLSGALVAQHGAALGGPVVEVEDLARPVLAGFLRAARHADAIVAVSGSAARLRSSPEAARAFADAALSAARETHFDRPLVLVARAPTETGGGAPGSAAALERLSAGLYRDLSAGFTSFSFRAASVSGDAAALARVCEPLLENQLGIEVELGENEQFDPALALASLDDILQQHGLPLAAVRGARADDELAGALFVCPLADAVALTIPRRALLTDAMNAATARFSAATLDDDERLEARAFEAAEELLAGARGTATRFLDALAKARE